MATYDFGDGGSAWHISSASAQIVEQDGRRLLHAHGGVIWLRDEPEATSLQLRAVVRSISGAAFAGIAFRGRDDGNYELVYASIPAEAGSPADAAQYDPVMGGSNTWQLFHGADHRASARLAPGTWLDLDLRVQGESVQVRLDGATVLHVPGLQLDEPGRRLGLWAYLPALFARLDVSPLPPTTSARAEPATRQRPALGRAWKVAAAPEGSAEQPSAGVWRTAREDETGLLNLNRAFAYEAGASALVEAEWVSPVAYVGTLRLGYSDECRARWNGEVVHEGEWRWAPDRGADGRVRPDNVVRVPVRAGLNKLTASVRVLEPFGWGIVAALDGPAVRA